MTCRATPRSTACAGFALIGMLGWHAEVLWLRGGFARMTIFFVLAGFLAARSYDRRRGGDRSAARAFASFWARRARRLLPLTVVGVWWAVLVTAWVGSDRARETVTGDAASVLLSLANWRFVADERPYGALFEAPSAFQHSWSLSLEEQCFVALPLVLALVTLGGRVTRRGVVVAALAALALGSVLLPRFVAMAPDTAYYGTHVRFGEFAAGMALAWALRDRAIDAWSARTYRLVGIAGGVGLAVLLATMLTLDRETAWLYRGGMGLFALPTVAVIAACTAGRPVVTAVLAMAPLRTLGRWAFAVYVVHWPLYQVLDETGIEPRALLLTVKLAAAIALGGIVHVLVERPLMGAGVTTGRPAAGRVLRAWARPRIAARSWASARRGRFRSARP